MSRNYKIAIERFKEQNPEIVNKLKSLDPKIADSLGVPFEEFYEQELHGLYKGYAASMGMSVIDMNMRLAADSEEQVKEMQLEYHQSTAEALGIDWGEFQKMNGISWEVLGNKHFVVS